MMGKEDHTSCLFSAFSNFFVLLLFLILTIHAGNVHAQESEGEALDSGFDAFMEKVNRMESDGRYEESRDSLLDKWEDFPEHWFKLAKELVYLNEKTDRYQENLPVFREGHERGYFFFLHPSLPSCEPYLQYDAFQAITEQDMALRAEAVKRSELSWEVQLPQDYNEARTWPVIMILHGGGSSIDRAREHWRSALLSKHFITVYVQSYLHYDSESFGWRKFDPRARDGLIACYNTLKTEYSIDTASIGICGISAGATMAMDAFVMQLWPIRTVIAFSPSKPTEFSHSLAGMKAGDAKSAIIMIGEEDSEQRLRESTEMAGALDSAGLKCDLHLIPNLGHDYPEDFPTVLDRALSMAFPEITTARENLLKIFELKGSPYDIGYQHGSLLRDEIHVVIDRWKEAIRDEYQIPPEAAIKRFLAETGSIAYIKQQAPGLYREAEGIADGAGIPFDIILAFQMGEELEVQGKHLFGPRCTAIAAPAGAEHPAVVSQNMDPPEFLHGFPTLLRIHYKGTPNAVMVYTVPGLIGLNGMNNRGLGVACNSISMLNSSGTGMPVAFVLRKLLECQNLEEAGRFLMGIKHATPQAYTIGDKDSVLCYECSANACKPYLTFEESGVVLHTNFSILNRDFNDTFIDVLAEYGKTTDDPYFCPRFFLTYDIVKEHIGNIDHTFLEGVLRMKEPEISPVLNRYTYGTTIMVLDENPEMYICPGNTHNRFDRVTFEQ